MKLVVDANVLFSALIKQSKTLELLLHPFFELYSVEFIFQEFEKHKDKVLEKTYVSSEDFNEVFEKIKKIITFIKEEDLIEYLEEADLITPDPDDVIYFALALKLNCPIWSQDKKLKQQDKIKIYSTEELVKKL